MWEQKAIIFFNVLLFEMSLVVVYIAVNILQIDILGVFLFTL